LRARAVFCFFAASRVSYEDRRVGMQVWGRGSAYVPESRIQNGWGCSFRDPCLSYFGVVSYRLDDMEELWTLCDRTYGSHFGWEEVFEIRVSTLHEGLDLI
jgi:hypothetical protein